MKRTFIILLLVYISQLRGQTVNEINKNLNIPDSLSNVSEIRIYKWFSITNGSEVFRMFLDENKKWNAILYKHFAAVGNKKSKVETFYLNFNENPVLVWLKILQTNIEFLPNLEDINYKLKKKEIVFEDGEYLMKTSMTSPLDGIAYKAFFRSGDKTNTINFSNFHVFLELYPEVDELNSYKNLLSVINNEFNIWK